jgi:hypothetical protein
MEAWNSAAVWVKKRRYQRALDQLQALIISRMFELTKMNMSGTGRQGAPCSEQLTDG